MLIQTTYMIKPEILALICDAAESLGKPVSFVISRLLGRVLKDEKIRGCIHSAVQYQKRDLDDNSSWKKVHVSLRSDEYEQVLDLRKVLKKSVSRILAEAVVQYLQELLESPRPESYPPRNYVLVKRTRDGVVSWQSYWGFPPDPDTISQT